MNVVTANSSKKSRCWSLIFHQWFFAWYKDAGLVVHESCYSCLVVETKNRVVEKVVVQFVHSTFVNVLCILATWCFQTRTCDFHVIFYHFFKTFAPKYNTKSIKTWINLLLVKYCSFWRTSFWGPSASDDVTLFRSASLQECKSSGAP